MRPAAAAFFGWGGDHSSYGAGMAGLPARCAPGTAPCSSPRRFRGRDFNVVCACSCRAIATGARVRAGGHGKRVNIVATHIARPSAHLTPAAPPPQGRPRRAKQLTSAGGRCRQKFDPMRSRRVLARRGHTAGSMRPPQTKRAWNRPYHPPLLAHPPCRAPFGGLSGLAASSVAARLRLDDGSEDPRRIFC